MEDTLAGVKAYYQASLPAALAAIAAARGEAVASWAVIDTAISKDRQYPKLEILPGPVAYDYGDEDAPFLEPIELHGVAVIVTQGGSEIASVQNLLLRYLEGIRTVTLADPSYGGRFNFVYLDSADPSDMLENQEDNQLLQALAIGLRVRVIRATAG